MMAQVYEYGFFTIASNLPTEDQTWEWEVPDPRKRLLPAESIVVSDDDEARHSSWLSQMLLQGPLAKRAWCLQERYLSPRLLHIFSDQLWI